MKLAIIGSGISGLTAAYYLHADHETTVFEAQAHVGGHTHTVDIELTSPQGTERHAIDTGFIVFNDRTYPNFRRLLHDLGVPTKPTTMSFSVQHLASQLEYNGRSLNTLFAQRRNLWRLEFHQFWIDILRFNRHARQLVEGADSDSSNRDHSRTVGEFVRRHRYSDSFVEHYLLPMGSAIWSCPTGRFAEFPIQFIAEFYHHHGLLNVRKRPTWRVVTGGSRNYVQAMTRSFADRIRLLTPIHQVLRRPDGVDIIPATGPPESFDHVIFACHSDQALRILGGDASEFEQRVLSSFPYQRNRALLHTDSTLLPRSRRAWASWNYRLGKENPNSAATVTYYMNLLQGLSSRHTICVTLNDQGAVAPARILQRLEYDHPVFTTSRQEAQRQHPNLLNTNRTSFCGAYWRNGFHEDGVVSALAVVNALRHTARQVPIAVGGRDEKGSAT